ncbi:MAG TPA: hypothetical protein VGH93_07795, partial [Solirubrobacteraceae bacterium]
MASELIDGADPRISTQPWSPGPERPQLEPSAVDIWRVDLSRVPDDLLELLPPEELVRFDPSAQFRRGALRARARAVLRALLGGYLRTDPRGLRLMADGRGKPALESAPLLDSPAAGRGAA